MSAVGAIVFPLARSYAAHAGIEIADDRLRADLEGRLAGAGNLSRGLFVGAALFVRAAAPVLFLGKPLGFSALSSDDREELLRRLQCARSPLLRGLYLGIKPLLTGLCYTPEFLKRAAEARV